MTANGRLARGKQNFENKVFLNNPETLEFIESIKPKPVPKAEKPKEAKDAKPAK